MVCTMMAMINDTLPLFDLSTAAANPSAGSAVAGSAAAGSAAAGRDAAGRDAAGKDAVVKSAAINSVADKQTQQNTFIQTEAGNKKANKKEAGKKETGKKEAGKENDPSQLDLLSVSSPTPVVSAGMTGPRCTEVQQYQDAHMQRAWHLSKQMQKQRQIRAPRSPSRLSPAQKHTIGHNICEHLIASLRAQVKLESNAVL